MNVQSFTGNGNDVSEIYIKTTKAISNIRLGKGPQFLVFDTYRWLEHCGPNYDNDIGYRTEEEFVMWKKKDPLKNFQEELINKNIISNKEISKIKREIEEEVHQSFEFAEKSPFPKPSEVSKYIFKE